jgi:periplasmic protein TonB
MFDNLRNMLDFDDLLFEKRNKDYGAYQLRKRYNSVLALCIVLACTVVIFAVVIPFISSSNSDRVLAGGSGYTQVDLEHFEPPIDQIMIPTAPPPPQAEKVQDIVKYVPPVVVDSLPPLEPTLPTSDELAIQKVDNQLDVTGMGSGEDMVAGEGSGDSDKPFFFVEIMPTFKGGDINKFREWIQKRTNYPEEAIKKRLKGKVFLTFIVEKDGSVTNVTVLKGVDPLLDDVAVKAISDSPKWSPGLQRGQPVRVRFQIPLDFRF